MKKRVNVTLDGQLVIAGKRVAKARQRSLSDLIESGLRRLVQEESPIALGDALDKEAHWLDRFHQKYLVDGFNPPSDSDIALIRRRKGARPEPGRHIVCVRRIGGQQKFSRLGPARSAPVEAAPKIKKIRIIKREEWPPPPPLPEEFTEETPLKKTGRRFSQKRKGRYITWVSKPAP